MVDIVHRVGIRAPLATVYSALATIDGISGWWTQHTKSASSNVNEFQVQFSDTAGRIIGSMEFEFAELLPEGRVVWKTISGPKEWLGTSITFELKQEAEYTIVLFGHRNWIESIEFTAHCSMKWGIFLMSLKSLCETGAGQPSPHDTKIDNWN